jgi:hypothetical protein
VSGRRHQQLGRVSVKQTNVWPRLRHLRHLRHFSKRGDANDGNDAKSVIWKSL